GSLWPGEVVLLHGLLLLLPLAALLLYRYNATFHYYCKVVFFNCWVVAMLGGVLLCAAILPLKWFYGIKIQVWGSEHLNIKEPYVIVCNHQASLDLMGMVEVIPDRCVPIAKKELMYMGTVGWACWLSGIIFIDRHKREDAIDVIAQTLRVWIFPEGTRNQEKSMLPFKRGAFHLAVQAQVPIFPIVISPYWDFFSSKDKKFTSGTCTIRILPKVETCGLSPKDVPRLTETVRQVMADALAELSADRCVDQGAEQPPFLRCAGARAGRGQGSPQCKEDTSRASN
uniref:1-acyl-sn-glycerol-3-phosphate acyltransferase n=1 Tax=Falco tinnunculus TaxID=100819 RepID=A0A8C4TP82_FALTI